MGAEYPAPLARTQLSYRDYHKPVPGDLPDELLSHLDHMWRAQRQKWNVAQVATIPGLSQMFAEVEKWLVREAGQRAAEKQLTILTSTGPRWFARPVSFAPADAEAGEHPWTPGTELPEGAHWQAVCRMSGWAVPTYTEET